MYQLLAAGGWVMPLIVACSVIALAICIERHFALNAEKVAPTHLLAFVWQQLRRDGLNAQQLKSLRAESPLGEILAAGLVNQHQGRDVMRESIREAASHVVYSLERNLSALGTIAAVTPLLGLLGTVLGMISVFADITTHGTGNANVLAGGISEALLTTAAGLAVAIPSLVMHRHYTARVESLVVGLEREAIKLVDALHAKQQTEQYL
ncbi:MAG: MotA/TolQ/ExbB proton channel family protein [Halieaceae bacterium]